MENKNTQGPANDIPIKLLWESVQDTREYLKHYWHAKNTDRFQYLFQGLGFFNFVHKQASPWSLHISVTL